MHGRTVVAFFLGLIEISFWIVVVSAMINQLAQEPILGVFYALGFSTGDVVDIKLEKSLALGFMGMRVIIRNDSQGLANTLRDAGYGVTVFFGEGKTGPVHVLFIVCRRRDIPKLLPLVNQIAPDAFYLTEQAGVIRKV